MSWISLPGAKFCADLARGFSTHMGKTFRPLIFVKNCHFWDWYGGTSKIIGQKPLSKNCLGINCRLIAKKF